RDCRWDQKRIVDVLHRAGRDHSVSVHVKNARGRERPQSVLIAVKAGDGEYIIASGDGRRLRKCISDEHSRRRGGINFYKLQMRRIDGEDIEVVLSRDSVDFGVDYRSAKGFANRHRAASHGQVGWTGPDTVIVEVFLAAADISIRVQCECPD